MTDKENITDFNAITIKLETDFIKKNIDKNELHGFFKGQTTPKPDRDHI